MSQNADLKSNVQKLTGSNAVPQMPHLFSGKSQGSSCRGLGDKEGFLHESRMSLGNIVMLVFLQVLVDDKRAIFRLPEAYLCSDVDSTAEANQLKNLLAQARV